MVTSWVITHTHKKNPKLRNKLKIMRSLEWTGCFGSPIRRGFVCLHWQPGSWLRRPGVLLILIHQLPEGLVGQNSWFCIGSSSWVIWLFSRSLVSRSLWPHGLQYARPLCPSTSPRACSNSCPLSQWCHPTVSSSVIPFSSCLQSFLASGSFPVSEFFASGGQSIRASASTSFLPINSQDWFPLLS